MANIEESQMINETMTLDSISDIEEWDGNIVVSPLKAPFPYYGNKSNWAKEVWKRFGAPDLYIEPFFGSGAILFANPNPAKREIVYETNGYICNFFRAIQFDYEELAWWADYPTVHQDLTARHKWLVKWGAENGKRLSEDPEYYDVKAAGFWVWGISLWIGSGFCMGNTIDGIPMMSTSPSGGRGVSAQRTTLPSDKIPLVTGLGINKMRTSLNTESVSDKRPHISSGQGVSKQKVKNLIYDSIPFSHGGQGVNKQRQSLGTSTERGKRLLPWFAALHDRLQNVIVINRHWSYKSLSPTQLSDTKTSSRKMNRCIFLDPPYPMKQRISNVYASDAEGTSDDVATEAYNWSIDHGHKYRIAYCSHEGDFPVPDGWEVLHKELRGVRRADKARDQIMFSPTCLKPPIEDEA